MIAAIDSSRLAAKDERAVGTAGQVQDQKFNRILHTASRREPSQALARLDRPGSPAEPQPRAVVGEAARPRPTADRPAVDRPAADRPADGPNARLEPGDERTAETDAEQPEQPEHAGAATAKSAAPTLRTAATDAQGETIQGLAKDKSHDKALTHAQPQPPSADELAGAAMLPGIVMTAQDIIDQSNAQTVARRSVNVQLGAAAYRMSPHGQGEAELAAALGAASPPGYTQPLDPAAALNGRNAIRDRSAAPEGEVKPEPVLVVDALAMVELSKRAQAARDAAANPDVARAPHGSAMARNQFLGQIGGQTATTPQVAAALQAMEPALKEMPKEPALPAKDLPAKALEGAPANAAPPAAAVTAGAAQAVDPPHTLPTHGQSPDTRMVDKVVQEARWLLRNNHQEVTMRMEPEHLGQLKLHVTQKDGALHVEMTVDTAAAKHLLDANVSQLRERFQQENLAQGQTLHVDVRHGGNSEFAQQSGRRESEAAGVAGIGRAVSSEETAAVAPRAAWSNSNVSIYA